LVASSRTQNTWLKSASLWHRTRVRLLAHASTGRRSVRAIWAGALLAAVMGWTTWVVGSVSIWCVPAYLVLMVIILVTPRAGQALVKGTKPTSRLTGSERTRAGHWARADLISVVGHHHPTVAPEAGSELAAEPDDAVRYCSNSAGSDAPKPRRVRVRGRKLARTGAEPVASSIPIAWVRVGPGKFIRADANVPMVDPVHSDRPNDSTGAPTDALLEAALHVPDQSSINWNAEQRDPTAGLAVSATLPSIMPVTLFTEQGAPNLIEMATDDGETTVGLDRCSGSETVAHGITPSATSENPCTNSPVDDWDRAESTDISGATGDFNSIVGAGATRRGMTSGVRPLLLRAFERRAVRVSPEIISGPPNAVRASSRSIPRIGRTHRTLASSSFLVNVHGQRTTHRTSRGMSSVYCTVGCRSPPFPRQVEAGAACTDTAGYRISIASP
jgi:hypothetical protein